MGKTKKQWSRIAALILSLAMVCSMLPIPALAAETDIVPVTLTVEYHQSEARDMLQMVNEFRTGSDTWVWKEDNVTKEYYTGLSTLKWDYELEKVAMQRAAEIALAFGHCRPDGRSPFTAYSDCGYQYYWAGENIAAGHFSVEDAFIGLREDDKEFDGQGHRRNMLDDDCDVMAAACVKCGGRYFFVQEFAKATSTSGAANASKPADGQADVNMNVLKSAATTTISLKSDYLFVDAGDSCELPSARIEIKVKIKTSECDCETWLGQNGCSVETPLSWEVEDSSIAKVSGTQITGIAEGTTNLKLTAISGQKNLMLMVIAPHVHSYTDTIIEPTCTQGGYTEHTCSSCGDSYTDTPTAALGHDYQGKVTKEPGCLKDGVRTFTCSRCGDSYTEPIKATGHDYMTSVIEPTCTQNGWTSHICMNCGDSYEDNEVAKLGHQFTNYEYNNDAQLGVDGTETAYCDRGCGESDTRTIPGTALPIVFTDVSPEIYYSQPVAWAVENGITKGTSSTKFSPDATCTRGQIVTFLWRANGSPKMSGVSNPFTDVLPGEYYYDAVLWAVGEGITSGTSATTFSPNAACTRGQVVTFLWRAQGEPSVRGRNPFTDVPQGQYYTDAVLWAVNRNITSGLSSTTFGPNAVCTRGQIVTFLYRCFHS